jgi:general secretion pathway protein D
MKWWLAALVCLGCLGVAGCQTTSTLQDRSKMMQPGGLVESKLATPKDATGLREGQLDADARAAGRQDADILSSMDARDMAFNRRLAQITGQSGGPGAVGRSEARAGAKAEAAETMEVSFDFFDADIADVVRLFMELLQENYSLDPAVKGKVALHVTAKMTRDEVWELFRGVLRFHAASTVLDGEVWRILPLAAVPSAIDEAGILFAGDGGSRRRGQSVQMFRLEYLPVSEFSNVIKPYLSPGSMVYGHEQSGVVLVADYPHTLRKIEKLVQVFDVSAFAGLHMRVFSLKYVKAEDMIKELDALSQSTMIRQQGRERVNYLAMPRLNMIVAMTWNEANLPFIEEWVAELDREAPTITGVEHEENIFVYYVENGIAKNIAESLDGLFNGKKDSETAYRSLKMEDKEEDDGLPVGSKLADQARETSGNIVDNTFDNTMQAQAAAGQAGGPGSFAGKLKGPVSFVVDESTNTILVKCVGSDYRVIKGVIDKLDIFPRQVLIEVLIAEINLDESNKLGVEWQYIFDLSGSGTARLGNLSLTNLLTDGPLTEGMSYLIANTERFKAAIQASATDNNVQILSSPHILASDNQKATIDIGSEVPVVTSQTLKDDATSTVTTTDQSVQYRNTGIILSVTPHINEKGLVRMEVSQEVSELSDKFIEGIPSPIFSKRKAETTLSVKDGQTIVIGGLIRQTRSDTYSGVPGLSRIPILRNLMGTESKGWENTELMLFITPHVVVHNDDTEFISRKFVERLESIKATFN